MNFTLNNGEKKNITVKRSKRISVRIKVDSGGNILVNAPKSSRDDKILQLLEKNRKWLEKKIAETEIRAEKSRNTVRLTEEEVRKLRREAEMYFTGRTAYYGNLMHISYGKITIRGQKTRWGSCTAKGDLNFNFALMLAPENVRDSVIVHELCHRREMNHGKEFKAMLNSMVPDEKECRKWLKENGLDILKRTNITE